MRVLRGLKTMLGANASSTKAASGPSAGDEFCAATGMRPIHQTSPGDVFIVGYPKSGHTWMQYLIAGAVCGADLRRAPDALVQDLTPDVHFKKFYKPWFPVTFFKSHFLPRPDYCKVVYLLRDGRDAMVSYRHYLEGLSGEKIDFLRLVQTGRDLFPCKWHEHVEKWLANPYAARMITVRYEDLKADTAAQLGRVCDFAGTPRDAATLEKAAQAASFSAMKQREATMQWENPQVPANKEFIRRGEIGSHREEMPAEVCDAFLRQAGAMMAKTGYLP